MKKTALVFPGQGSQFVGMGKTLHEAYPSVRRLYEEANDALGVDIRGISFDGPQSELDRTEFTQPALLCASYAAWLAIKEVKTPELTCLAGHSLGEYTALVASRAMNFIDAVKLVRLRGRFMQESVPSGEGRMCAVLGLGVDAVKEVCASVSGGAEVAVAANINSPEQIVISGHAGAVDRASVLLKERGAKRVVPLQVSAPSHSPLMSRAAALLKEELEAIEITDPSVPVISNVEALPVDSAASIKELLEKQLVSPVRWVDTIVCMGSTLGVRLIAEVGPGKVLSGLIRRIDKEIETINIGEAADVEKGVSTLMGGAE